MLNLYRFNIKEFRELYQDKFYWIFNVDSPFVLKLKKDDNVDSAIKHMKEKEYFQKFIKENKNVLLVAICYDSKIKNHSCKIESVYFSEV